MEYILKLFFMEDQPGSFFFPHVLFNLIFLVFLGCLKIAGRFESVPPVHFDGGADFIH